MMTSPTIRVGPFRWQCSAPGSSGAVSRSGPCRRVSLASRLPSPPSALSVLSLFGSFVGTMQLLDSLPPCMRACPCEFPFRPAALRRSGSGRVSRFSRAQRAPGFSACVGSSTPQDRPRTRVFLCTAVWPSDGLTPWASWITDFGAQYPAYRYPCPTLQVQPHDCPRMARGQGGSLFLPCTTLAFATPCRFIPALSRPAVCPTRTVGPMELPFLAAGRSRSRGAAGETQRLHLRARPVGEIVGGEALHQLAEFLLALRALAHFHQRGALHIERVGGFVVVRIFFQDHIELREGIIQFVLFGVHLRDVKLRVGLQGAVAVVLQVIAEPLQRQVVLAAAAVAHGVLVQGFGGDWGKAAGGRPRTGYDSRRA